MNLVMDSRAIRLVANVPRLSRAHVQRQCSRCMLAFQSFAPSCRTAIQISTCLRSIDHSDANVKALARAAKVGKHGATTQVLKRGAAT